MSFTNGSAVGSRLRFVPRLSYVDVTFISFRPTALMKRPMKGTVRSVTPRGRLKNARTADIVVSGFQGQWFSGWGSAFGGDVVM